eukprot:scaffold2952_cov40-Tisochrysis_lutea.AAC.1
MFAAAALVPSIGCERAKSERRWEHREGACAVCTWVPVGTAISGEDEEEARRERAVAPRQRRAEASARERRPSVR